MARVTTELNNTQIKNAKAQTKDYKLMDGKGLFLLVKKTARSYGGLGIKADYRQRERFRHRQLPRNYPSPSKND